MSAITSQTFGHSPRLHAPFGARVAAEVVLAGARLMARLTQAPRIRALRVARARDAESVRSLARSVERSDPGFAADLYAAAARHDGLND